MTQMPANIHRTGRAARSVSTALFALLLAGNVGHGAIVCFWSQNISIPNTFAGVSVDLETGAYSTSLAGISGGDANLFFGGAVVGNDADQHRTAPTWQPVRTGTGRLDPIIRLDTGVTVGESSTYSSGYGASGDPYSHLGIDPEDFKAGEPGYIGFSLGIDDPQTPGIDNDLTVYGWMLVRLEARRGGIGEILEWAYEDTGVPLVVGVPEPPITALAGIALAGVALWRRRSG